MIKPLKDLKKKTVKAIFWTFIDRAGSQFIGFVITIFLARLLSPAEFGLVAMASVVVAITRIFIDSGLNDSLIQKKECTQADFSTVFFFNMVMSALLFIIIFFLAPLIASFFGYVELVPVIRLIGLKPVFASFAFVQSTILQRDLKFQVLAKLRLPAFLISGAIGITLAFYGFGVWALVWQSILETLIFVIFLWVAARWRPVFIFDKDVFNFHWKHGSRLLMVNALGAVYRNAFTLIIGKFFSAAQLGFFSRAESFRTITLNNTVGIVQAVSYPVLSKFQDDDKALKSNYRKILQMTVFGLLPVVAIFIVAAKPIIIFLLTDKWTAVAPILVVLMLSVIFTPFNSINLNILKIKRRTDLLLRTDVVNKILLVIILLITLNLGFDYLVMSNLLVGVLALGINNFYANKLISYSIREQLSDLWSPLLAFVVTVLGASFLIGKLNLISFPFVAIVVSIVLCGLIYIVAIYLLNRNLIQAVVKEFNSLIPRRNAHD